MGVAPWALAGVPETAGCYLWLVWAATAMEAEALAERWAADRARKPKGFNPPSMLRRAG